MYKKRGKILEIAQHFPFGHLQIGQELNLLLSSRITL